MIVVDVQNYFINEHTRRIVPRIAGHLRRFTYDALAFTQFINNEESSFRRIFGWTKCAGSPDADICDELVPWIRPDNVFPKNGFSAFKSKKLIAYLRRRRITDLDICGTDTEACVLASALEAFELGYRVRVLHALCASTNGEGFHRYGQAILQRNLERPPRV